MNIALLGRHANRTPLAYEAYQAMLPSDIHIVSSPEQADIAVFGFDIDIAELSPRQHEWLEKRTDMRVMVISEEPLWDTIWAADYQSDDVCLANGIRYECYNHFTSGVFEFEKIPYFLTTNNDFLVKYVPLLQRSMHMSTRELRKHWSLAQYKGAFFLERREDPRYAKRDAAGGSLGLSCLRSDIAAKFYGLERYLFAGKGWASQMPRQQSTDWHLEKITMCNQKVRTLMSVENTLQKDYITEKVFDAYACGAVPLIHSCQDHRYVDLFPNGSYLNLASLSPDAAFEVVEGVEFTDELADRYRADVNLLLERTLTPTNLVDERNRVLNEVVAVLRQ